jgi:hypothetical protein
VKATNRAESVPARLLNRTRAEKAAFNLMMTEIGLARSG